MALVVGVLLVALLGIGHHFGILAIRWVLPNPTYRRSTATITVFTGLLVLHVLEIVAFAAAYAALLRWPYMGSLSENYEGTWFGLIYFSGINFSTLGYTAIETEGPIRLVNMMQSLGGFMVLTWSATFIYSVWSKASGDD